MKSLEMIFLYVFAVLFTLKLSTFSCLRCT